jgi:hypothetical protein
MKRLTLILLVFLIACSPPSAQPGQSIPPTETPGSNGVFATLPIESSASSEPVAYEVAPPAGTTVTWFDFSTFVFVPGGDFLMGDDIGQDDNSPSRTVRLDGFWIHQSEVTQQQYALCVAAGVCSPPVKIANQPYWFDDPEKANWPVTGVTWAQADAYCEWIVARLPSEAEWEKASRGENGATYAWGEAEPTCELGHFAGCATTGAPRQVGVSLEGASPFGLLDAAGNVYEWVNDWYTDDVSRLPVENPLGPESGFQRVVRSSSYQTQPSNSAIAQRHANDPQKAHEDLGFRCVLTDKPAPPPVCQGTAAVIGGQQPVLGGQPFNVQLVSSYCVQDQNGGFNLNLGELAGVPVAVNNGGVMNNSISCKVNVNDSSLLYCSIGADQSYKIYVCPTLEGLGKLSENLNSDDPVVSGYCPPGYSLDKQTGECKFNGGKCPPGYKLSFSPSGASCIPLDNESVKMSPDGTCPPGYFKTNYGDYSVCTIAHATYCEDFYTQPSACLISTTCPSGLNYDAELGCCSLPTEGPYCPPGTIIQSFKQGNEIIRTCVAEVFACDILTVQVPACPKPTPPPSTGGDRCSQFAGNIAACTAAGCRYIPLTGACNSP